MSLNKLQSGLNKTPGWSIAIHGGAGNISKARDCKAEARELRVALDRAVSVITERSSGVLLEWSNESTLAMRAVVEAVVAMEDCPLFNAGLGSVLNAEGACEMEAAVMEGSLMDSGACCGVTTTANPILLAELVRTRTDHTFVGFEPIDKLAREWGLRQEDPSHFVLENRVQNLRIAQQQDIVVRDVDAEVDDLPDAKGTVGAVARDSDGNLAVAVSTGGKTNKLAGRIGDSPCIGTGCYATRVAAVCGTGIGESFVNQAAAARVCFAMEYGGLTLADAVKMVLREHVDQGAGGIIAVDAEGNIVMDINCPGMFRAGADSGGYNEVSIWDENLVEGFSNRQ